MIRGISKNKHFYNLSQRILAPWAFKNVKKRLTSRLLFDSQKQYQILELGCGTGLFRIVQSNIHYIGIDTNLQYFPNSSSENESYLEMDATRLAFPPNHFDLVYSCGLYHHLSNDQVRSSLSESYRVSKSGGKIVIFDNIRPTSRFNIFAKLIRKFDRGKFVRTSDELLALIRGVNLNLDFSDIFYYNPAGLEGIIIGITK